LLTAGRAGDGCGAASGGVDGGSITAGFTTSVVVMTGAAVALGDLGAALVVRAVVVFAPVDRVPRVVVFEPTDAAAVLAVPVAGRRLGVGDALGGAVSSSPAFAVT
jgi:hypothetical protein